MPGTVWGQEYSAILQHFMRQDFLTIRPTPFPDFQLENTLMFLRLEMKEKPQETPWREWDSTLFCKYYKGKPADKEMLYIPSPIIMVVYQV